MTQDELTLLLAVLDQAKRDAETVHDEFRGKNDPVNADTADIEKAVSIVERELASHVDK